MTFQLKTRTGFILSLLFRHISFNVPHQSQPNLLKTFCYLPHVASPSLVLEHVRIPQHRNTCFINPTTGARAINGRSLEIKVSTWQVIKVPSQGKRALHFWIIKKSCLPSTHTNYKKHESICSSQPYLSQIGAFHGRGWQPLTPWKTTHLAVKCDKAEPRPSTR